MDKFKKKLSSILSSEEEVQSLQNTQEHKDEPINLTTVLDYDKLVAIKKDFKLRASGLSRNEFITVMLYHMPEFADKLKLVQALTDLFDEIDIHETNFLQWSEFSNYIIEQRLLRQDNTEGTIQKYRASDVTDTIKHENEVDFMEYFPGLKSLIMIERDSHKLRLYSSNYKHFKDISIQKGTLLYALYLDELKITAVCCNDMHIYLWDEYWVLRFKIKCKGIPLVLCWNSQRMILYAGTSTHLILSWNLNNIFKASSKVPLPKLKELKHPGSVQALLPINKLKLLITADLLGNMFVWNLNTHQLERTMDRSRKAITHLTYDDVSGFVFSSGMDKDAYVWNPYVSNYINRLVGHLRSLIGIKCVPDSFQIVTADVSGIFKVWDVRTFECMQTLQSPLQELTCFAVIYPQKKIILAAKKTIVYDYAEIDIQGRTDGKGCIGCIYNKVYNCIITGHPDCIKVWDADTGSLVQTLKELSSNEITALEIDSSNRRLFIGDSQGQLTGINLKNGTILNALNNHKGEVSCIRYWTRYKLVITASWDMQAKVHDDSRRRKNLPIRYDKIWHENPINTISFKNETRQLATGGDDGKIQIQNLMTLRHEATLEGHTAEVKCIVMLETLDCLISSDLDGYICFWGLRPSPLANCKFYEIRAGYRDQVDEFSVISMHLIEKTKILVTGNEDGCVKIWDFSRLLEKFASLGKEREERTSDTFALTLSESSAPTILQQIKPRIVKTFKAHDDGIREIRVLEVSNPVIFTTSFDCKVKLWDFKGNIIGRLSNAGDPNWGLKAFLPARLDMRRCQAQVALKEAEKSSYFDTVRSMRGSVMQNSDDEGDSLGEQRRFRPPPSFFQPLKVGNYDNEILKKRSAGFSLSTRGTLDQRLSRSRERGRNAQTRARMRLNTSYENRNSVTSHSFQRVNINTNNY